MKTLDLHENFLVWRKMAKVGIYCEFTVYPPKKLAKTRKITIL